MPDSLRPYGVHHDRPPSPLPTPGVYSNSCPLNQWCHPIISSSVVPFSSNSVQLSCSVMSDSWQPHGLQQARLPCPSPTPEAYSVSCPSSQWCHPTISSSVGPFSSCVQSFPASGSFPMSRLFVSGGPSVGASASASVLPKNIQAWFPLRLTGLISFQSKRLSRVFSPTPQFKSINSLALSLLYGPTLTSIHDYWKNHSFDQMDLCCRVMSLLSNILTHLS